MARKALGGHPWVYVPQTTNSQRGDRVEIDGDIYGVVDVRDWSGHGRISGTLMLVLTRKPLRTRRHRSATQRREPLWGGLGAPDSANIL